MRPLLLGFTVVAVLGASFWGCSSSGSGSSVTSRNRVAFIGDRDTALTDELFYNVEVTGGGSVVKASGTLRRKSNFTLRVIITNLSSLSTSYFIIFITKLPL